MPNKGVLVSIIILNWNGKRDTLECISSLKKLKTKFRYEIVVVDNGSSDGSARVFKKVSRIRLIRNESNAGFAEGNNMGARAARGKYILLLNNDTTVEPDFLQKLVGAMESDGSIGIAGPKICYYDRPDVIWSAGVKLDYLVGRPSLIGKGQKDAGQFDGLKQVDAIVGCALLARKDLFDRFMLDKKYFSYYEESKFCEQVKVVGYKCIFVPQSKMYHKVAASTGGGANPQSVYYLVRNRLFFVSDCVPFYFKPTAFLSSIVEVVLRCVIYSASGNHNSARAAVTGFIDFLQGRSGERVIF